MHMITRSTIGALLTAAIATTAAAPAAAGDYYGRSYNGYHGHYRGGGFGVGEFLLGAALVGGIAAIVSSNDHSRSPAYDRVDDGYPPQGTAPRGYVDERDGPPSPVEQCSRAAEREAQASGGYARVTGIDSVRPFRDGARVFGTLQIDYQADGDAPRRDRTRFDCTANAGGVTGLRVG